MKEKITLKDLITLTIGMAIVSAAIYYCMLSSNIVVGSISGLIMVITEFIPIPVSIMTFFVNVLLLIIGFIFIGREFGIKTVITSLMLPVYLWIFEHITPDAPPPTDDMFVNMLCYVLVSCFGQAILFNANASSGGLDIIAKVLNKYTHAEIGKSLSIAGYATALSSILVYDRKTLVISLLGTYLCGLALDHFIDGFSIRKRVCILSENYEAIQKFIVQELHRGATLYPAYGGLDHQEKTEVVTILEKAEYAKLLGYIHETDPSAFLTVSTVGEVIGNWHKGRSKRLG